MYIGHPAVRVVDDELRRPAGRGALDRGVDLVLQQRAAKRVAVAAGAALVPVDDAGDAFHVA
jgi:hypothetical protein